MNLGLSIRVSANGSIFTRRCTVEEHVAIIQWEDFAGRFVPDGPEGELPACKNQQWTRSDGNTLCRCGRLYSEHVGLHLLCNGDLVKL